MAPAPMTASCVLNFRILKVLAAVVLFVPGLAMADSSRGVDRESGATLAKRLLAHEGVSLLSFHVSGRKDQATALLNMVQASEGRAAKRSYYGNAPGGSVRLDPKMLRAMMILVNEGYTFRITELAGGSHSSTSRHYSGVAFDIDTLNGKRIRWGHSSMKRFIKRCRELGATEICGPGTRGHSTHLHVAWPR